MRRARPRGIRSAETTAIGIPLLIAGLWAAAAAAGGPVRLEIDPTRSEVGFRLSTTWHGVEGRTKAVSGSISSKSGDLFTDAQVSIEIEAAKLDTGNATRDRKMRDDCLETAKHPKITFVSTAPPKVSSSSKDTAGAAGEASLTIPGDLTMHGVKRGVVLPVAARRDGAAWVVSGKLAVRLSEYSIPDPSIFFNRVQDEVIVTFTVRTDQHAAAPTPD